MTVEVDERADGPAEGGAITVQRLGTRPTDYAAIRRWRRRAMVAAALLYAAGAILLWQSARPAADPPDEALAAETRDQVVIAASEAVETLNTLDHRDVAGGLDDWESVTTGELGDQVAAIDTDQVDALADAGAVSRARVVEAAVLDLDDGDGTAEVIAFTEVTVSPASGADAVRRTRYVVEMRRVDDRWLVASLTPMELER